MVTMTTMAVTNGARNKEDETRNGQSDGGKSDRW